MVKKFALALATILALSSKTNAQTFDLNLFPEKPVERSVMADADILKTEINLPSELQENLFDKQFKEFVPHVSLSKEIPIFSFDIKSKIPKIISSESRDYSKSRADYEGTTLSDKIFSANLVTGARLRFPDDKNVQYATKTELFLSSPIINDYANDGSKLFLVAGLNNNGTIQNAGEASINSFQDFIKNNHYSFSGDIYLVGNSPYSKQYFILRGGLENLFGDEEEKTNVNFSMTFELPSVISFIKGIKNFKIQPYVSLATKTPLGDSRGDIAIELGTKLTGKKEKSLILYGRADYGTKNEYSAGMKLEL